MWVARDKSGNLYLYTEKPIRNKYGLGCWGCEYICRSMKLESELFPYLKFEDEPIEVCLYKNNEKYHIVTIEALERIYQEALRLEKMIQKYNSLPWYKRIFSKIE